MIDALFCIGIVCLVAGLNLVLAVLFHLHTERKPVLSEIKPTPAKHVSKQDAWTEPPSYDYQRTSIMGGPVAPIEPGDSDPPEPYQ